VILVVISFVVLFRRGELHNRLRPVLAIAFGILLVVLGEWLRDAVWWATVYGFQTAA
jgi:hypothetical protein